MTIELSAFNWVPPFAQGLVRDLRVRWALEEAGLAYDPMLLAQGEQKSERYLALQPFGQVPAYREDGLEMFESGAIVLHVAEKSEILMPRDPVGRARTITWMFAALNTVEPAVAMLPFLDIFHAGEAWAKEGRPAVIELVELRLATLAERLGTRDYLEDRFTAADLLMSSVLLSLRDTDLVSGCPALERYVTRCTTRPAYQKALADQMAPFEENAPAEART
jgi:glutathione S-transferase